MQENDPFHTEARGSVMTAPLPRVLTVHTPDLVDLIQDPHAQGPVLVHMNAISGYHGQEAESITSSYTMKNDSSQFLVIMSFKSAKKIIIVFSVYLNKKNPNSKLSCLLSCENVLNILCNVKIHELGQT